MYLDHFGLSEPPFRITPVTEFFFSGAKRGEILEALVYSISEVEGIVKVSGEVGSGKTMLCRMLLERLPGHIETIYLANPSLSREEMLYAIADGLGLNIKGERVGIIMQSIQNRLEEKAREGKRVAVLVDEAHAMPPETLEELRLLYNLQVGSSKLLQIVLFGQPELNAKLDQPNMRQLKDRIVHHFNMRPLSRDILENYLMFRMRAAGYHGPSIFSAGAVRLIADASSGLMRRVNILADKSLLAAFIGDTHLVEPAHVKAALQDSEIAPVRNLSRKYWVVVGAAFLMVVIGLSAWWVLNKAEPSASPQQAKPQMRDVVPPSSRPTDLSAAPALSEPAAAATEHPEGPAPAAAPAQAPTAQEAPSAPITTARKTPLFEQRLASGKRLLQQRQAVASIQLYSVDGINPARMEGFLVRADKLGVLGEIYLIPAKFGNRDGLRVLYGAYPSADAAHDAIKSLPLRYQQTFATSTYMF
jgi:MSHA biogenesis protein MshM